MRSSLIKFICIFFLMRSGLRKITREPIRSPSPDIANKNIIANTKAPVAEILKKSRVSSYSCNAVLMQGVNSIEDLQRAVIDWEEKYRIIERQLNNMMLRIPPLKLKLASSENYWPIISLFSCSKTKTGRRWDWGNMRHGSLVWWRKLEGFRSCCSDRKKKVNFWKIKMGRLRRSS